MLRVALTGGVGSGKSSVAREWAASGVPVVLLDDLARRVTEPGAPALREIRVAFGEKVLTADGSLDRSAMRALVFRDPEGRARLESILHPAIWALHAAWLEERRGEGAPLVVSEVPLLYETEREKEFDVVVVVDAPEEERVARLVADRGIDAEEARRIAAAQMPSREKRHRADIVIENTGSLAALRARAREVLDDLRVRGSGVLRMDLHLHSRGSWDCLSDPEALLDTARRRGFGRIAITDHNRLGVALRMNESYPEEIIAGEEVRTAEGIDVIGLYLIDEIPKGTGAEETIHRIREQGGIAYLPHPYAGGKGGGGRLADRLAPLCDVVEVFNARLHAPGANARAEALAVRHGRLRGAGSDAHTLGEIGNAFVELPAHPNRPEALRAGLTSARLGGREASRMVHLASTWAKIRKRLASGR